MLPDRVAAVITHNKKILLVGNEKHSLFWTPGGKVENGESHQETMKRELQEELNLSLTSFSPYFSYVILHDFLHKKQHVHCYFVEYTGNPIPSQEITKLGWFSQKELPELTTGIRLSLIPKLIQDGLL